MADAARFGEEAQNHRTRYRELQEATEFPKAKQSKLLAAMERKQQLRSLSPGRNSEESLQDVLVLEDKFSEVEVEEARGGEKGEESGGG